MDFGDREHALSQSAGLVKDHAAGTGQSLQVVGTLDQDAVTGSTANATKKGQRNGDDQSAGAADDQEGQGTIDPCAPFPAEPHGQPDDRRQDGQHQGRDTDDWGIVVGKTGDEPFRPGFLHGGILRQLQDTSYGGVLIQFGGLDDQHTIQIHAAADDRIPRHCRTGQTLTGECTGVQGGGAREDDPIDGDALPRQHGDLRPHFHFFRIHLRQLTVLIGHVGVLRMDVHQLGNALTALAHGKALEQLA